MQYNGYNSTCIGINDGIKQNKKELIECNLEWENCKKEGIKKDKLDEERIVTIQEKNEAFNICNGQLKILKAKQKEQGNKKSTKKYHNKQENLKTLKSPKKNIEIDKNNINSKKNRQKIKIHLDNNDIIIKALTKYYDLKYIYIYSIKRNKNLNDELNEKNKKKIILNNSINQDCKPIFYNLLQLEHELGECNVEWGSCKQENIQKDKLDEKRLEEIRKQERRYNSCSNQLNLKKKIYLFS